MKCKVILMLSYMAFSSTCMLFACMMEERPILVTIFTFWTTVNLMIFALILRIMGHGILNLNKMRISWRTSGIGSVYGTACEKDEEDPLSAFYRQYDLTKRELEILNEICCGKTNMEIADALYISESTVKTHVSHAYKKLGVKNRTEAVCLVKSQL